MSHSIVYPDNCIQSVVEPWWTEEKASGLDRGRLIWTVVSYVSQEPRILKPTGRKTPTDHSRADYQISTMKGTVVEDAATLPVAAFPHHDNEQLIVSRAKRRPALVISTQGTTVPKAFRIGKARHQTAPTILVAPFFGATLSASRSGFNPEFMMRIRACD